MILKEIELFEGIDFEVMNEIAGICSEENYSKDTTIFEKDEQAKCLYILLEGTVYLVIQNGVSITYHLSDSGDGFGAVKGLLVGSVSRKVIHLSTCPVMVVH